MNDRDFKKHIRDLAHGHHHPEEHDWVDGGVRVTGEPTTSGGQGVARKPVKRATRASGRKTKKKA